MVNCPDASNLQSGDYILGYQNGQSPHYRRVTPAEILNGGFPASHSTLNATSGGTLGGAWVMNGPAQALTVQNNGTFGGSLGVSGAFAASGGGQFTGAFSLSGGPLTITSAGTALSVTNSAVVGGSLGVSGTGTFNLLRARSANFASGSTPTPIGPGDVIFEPDCTFATEGAPLGCMAFSNNAGTYSKILSPTALTMSIAGLTGRLGGSVPGQGNGSALLTCSGAFVVGNALTTNASGTCIDAGVPPGGGGGGGGTVTNCAIGGSSLAAYPGIGTSVSCLTQVNGSVVARTAAGVLGETATLPSAITAPNLNLTGTATAAAVTLTGGLTEAASVAGGANHVCTAGTAPTSPANGAEWCTTNGHFGKYAVSVTPIGPFIGLAQLSVSGGALAYNNTTGAFTCPGCVTTWTAPLSFVTGTASVASFPWLAVWEGDTATTVHNDTYFLPPRWRYASGSISDIYFWTGAGSFTVTVTANGSNVTGCTNIAVTTANTAASPGTATCTAANTLTHNQALGLVISSAAGSPVSAGVGIDGVFTP